VVICSCRECGVEFLSLSTHLHAKSVYEMTGERCLPLVHASEAGKLDGRLPAGVTEVMSTDSGSLLQAHAVIQGLLVLGDDIHGCGVACACGVEVGRGVVVVVVVAAAAAAAAEAAVEAAIVAAVREGTGAEQGGLAVAVGHRRASPRQDT
jgi:hypothetical protein